MVLGCLRGDPAKEITGYLRKARRFSLHPLCRDLVLTPDNLFSEFNTQIPKIPLCERLRRACISDKTWAAIDARLTVRREGPQRTVRKLIQSIHAGLRTDRKRWAEEAGRTIRLPHCKRNVGPDAGVVEGCGR